MLKCSLSFSCHSKYWCSHLKRFGVPISEFLVASFLDLKVSLAGMPTAGSSRHLLLEWQFATTGAGAAQTVTQCTSAETKTIGDRGWNFLTMQQHNIATVYCRRHILPKLRLHCLSKYLDDLLTCDNKDHIADEKASAKPREEADERVHGVANCS